MKKQSELENLERCSKIFVSWKKFSLVVLSFIVAFIIAVYTYSSTITTIDVKVKGYDEDIKDIKERQKRIIEMHETINKIADKLEVE